MNPLCIHPGCHCSNSQIWIQNFPFMRDDIGECVVCHHPVTEHGILSGGPYQFNGFAPFTQAEIQAPHFLNGLFIYAPLIQPFPLGGFPNPQQLLPLLQSGEISGTVQDYRYTIPAIMFLLSDPEDPMHGEFVQISRNDALLRLLVFACGMTLKRTVQVITSSEITRPDVSLYSYGVPLILVEEKSDSVQEALRDLNAKFVWTAYLNSLPFVINFAFSCSEFRIYRRESNQNTTHVHIFQSALYTVAERWNCIKAVMNVGRLINYWTQTFAYTPSALAYDTEFTHQVGFGNITKKINIGVSGVRVKYNNAAFYQRMKHLYEHMEGQVPNVEFMHAHNDDSFSFVLHPVGANRPPHTPRELVFALYHVLSAVLALHDIGYIHTDIRWSNIVITMERTWSLIDFTRFCFKSGETTLRRQRVTSFRSHQDYAIRRCLMPYGGGEWTPRHDLYQVGRLITECAVHRHLVEQQLVIQPNPAYINQLNAFSVPPAVIPTIKSLAAANPAPVLPNLPAQFQALQDFRDHALGYERRFTPDHVRNHLTSLVALYNQLPPV